MEREILTNVSSPCPFPKNRRLMNIIINLINQSSFSLSLSLFNYNNLFFSIFDKFYDKKIDYTKFFVSPYAI